RLTRLSIQWARAARPYALSLHDALPISAVGDQALLRAGAGAQRGRPRQHPLLETVLLLVEQGLEDAGPGAEAAEDGALAQPGARSEEHTSELQSREKLVCRLLLGKKNSP